jgi:hypothetical protein
MRERPKRTGSVADEAQQDIYRRTVEEHSRVASGVGPVADRRRRVLEGEAAKHGIRIQQKESKGRPK